MSREEEVREGNKKLKQTRYKYAQSKNDAQEGLLSRSSKDSQGAN